MHRDYKALFEQWLIGIGVAAIPFVYGIYCLFAQRSSFFLGLIHYHVATTGLSATFLAAAYIAGGIATHLLFFWGGHPRFGNTKCVLVAIFLCLLFYGLAAYRVSYPA